jgi:polyisoprenyl-teichoic acid--peptidoglycan teichoic acid transferase
MNEAIRQVTHVQNIRYDKATERLYIIDQTLLPNEEKEIELRTVEEMIEAIKMLRIRGAPAIGGVNFDVPINMDYDDPIQNLSIHFKKGVQYLNGADAMRVVRFRHNNDGTGYGSEDLGRMQTQQKFLKAVAKKMLTASNILTKIDDYAKIFNQYVDTDLSVGNLVWLGTEVLKMGVDKIDFSTLPNEWRSPYIYLIPDETLTLVNTYLNPYVEDRTAEDLHLPS